VQGEKGEGETHSLTYILRGEQGVYHLREEEKEIVPNSNYTEKGGNNEKSVLYLSLFPTTKRKKKKKGQKIVFFRAIEKGNDRKKKGTGATQISTLEERGKREEVSGLLQGKERLHQGGGGEGAMMKKKAISYFSR